MRMFLKTRVRGRIEFGLIYGGIALLVLLAARVQPVRQAAPACVLQGLTGLPCPTCGSTRSLVSLAHGDLAASLILNPLISLICMAAALMFLYSLITIIPGMKRVEINFTDLEKKTIRYGAAVLFFLNWGYLVLTLGQLP